MTLTFKNKILRLRVPGGWGGWRGPALLAFALAALAGCARFEPKPLAADESAARLESRSLTNEALRSFLETNLQHELKNWPTMAWDLDLLTLAAFYYQPSLEVARAQWAVAQGGETTAAQRPNPTLTVTPGFNSTTAMASPWIPLGYVDIPIETAGKRRYRRVQAAHLSEAARLSVAAAAWQVRSNVRTALIDWGAARQRESLVRQQLELQEQVVKRLEQQVQAGAIAGTEALPYRIALQKSRLDLADAQRLQVDSRSRLAEAIGVPYSALEEVEFALEPLPPADVARNLTSADVRRAALQNRADILSALSQYAASQAALQLEIAKQYPDIHLQPGYQFDQGDNKWTLGLVVDLPVLSQNQGPIAEAKGRRWEAAAHFETVQAKVLADIDRAVQGLRVAEQTSATLRTLAEEQARRRDTVAAQLKAGAADQVELLNAQLEYASAALLQLDAQTKLQQAAGAVEDAVQRPFQLPSAIFQSTDAHASAH
jgi:outer membrane protein TolC